MIGWIEAQTTQCLPLQILAMSFLMLGSGLIASPAKGLTLLSLSTDSLTATATATVTAQAISESNISEMRQPKSQAVTQLPDFLWDLIPPDIIPNNEFVQQMGELLQLVGDRQGQYAILTASALAYDDPTLISWLSAVQATPLGRIEINGLDLGEFSQQLSVTIAQRDATMNAIARQAFSEIQQASQISPVSQTSQTEDETETTQSSDFSIFPDLRQPGPFGVEKLALGEGFSIGTIESSAIGGTRTTERPEASAIMEDIAVDIAVDVYWPDFLLRGSLATSRPATLGKVPVVIISHGVGGQRTHFSQLAEHLASYGFVVVVPDHDISNASVSNQENVESSLSPSGSWIPESLSELGDQVFGAMNPVEFVKRPLTISAILDELEHLNHSHPLLMGRLDTDRVGLIGHSLGGYTGLALASGKVNRRQLRRMCRDHNTLALNLSLMLQCQAQALPRRLPKLYDSRIQAVMALNPVASAVLGEKQIADIEIPVMIVAGSHDAIAPLQSESLPAFSWLTTPNKYFVTLVPGGHSSANQYARSNSSALNLPTSNPSTPNSPDSSETNNSHRQRGLNPSHVLSPITIGPQQVYGGPITQALSVAFMATHLSIALPEETAPDRYLNAAYGQFLSEQTLTIHFITDSRTL